MTANCSFGRDGSKRQSRNSFRLAVLSTAGLDQFIVGSEAPIARRSSPNAPPVTPFGKFSRLTEFCADDTIGARSRKRSMPRSETLRRDAVGAAWVGGSTPSHRSGGCWPRPYALKNSRAPVRTDTNRTKGSRSDHARRGVEPIDRI